MRLNTEKIKNAMQVNNLTIDDISARTGIYKKSVEWILDSGFASEEAVERIADAVGLELSDVYIPDASAFDENTIEFVTGCKRATVTVSQRRYISKLLKLAEKYPEECQVVAVNKDPEKNSKKESILVHVPVRWIKISPLKEVSEEQREIARQTMLNLHAKYGTATQIS